MAQKPLEQVLEENRERLMSLPGVVGTALGSVAGGPCIKVYIDRSTSNLRLQLPSQIEGYRVVQETGEFKALDVS